jgi:hypothetical protein
MTDMKQAGARDAGPLLNDRSAGSNNTNSGSESCEQAHSTKANPQRIRAEDNGVSVERRAATIRKKLPDVYSVGAWRKVLPIHPAAGWIREATYEERRQLAGDLRERGHQVPVLLVRVAGGRPQLLDGRTRLDLLEALGIKVIDDAGPVLVPHDIIDVANDAEAEAHSLSLNVHRRHLTAEDKRGYIREQLRARPEQSDRQTAAAIVGLGGVQVDHKTVGAVRRKLQATGEIPQLDKTVGADGKNRARKKKLRPRGSSSSPQAVEDPESRFQADLQRLEVAWEVACEPARFAFLAKEEVAFRLAELEAPGPDCGGTGLCPPVEDEQAQPSCTPSQETASYASSAASTSTIPYDDGPDLPACLRREPASTGRAS